MTAPTGYDPAEYPPFAVTVDIAVFTVRGDTLLVAVVERGSEPYQGSWALPGGFVEPDEDLLSAARRELVEETGLDSAASQLEQLGAYGDPDRDPRMRVVTVAYWAIAPDLADPRGGGDAATAELVEPETVLAEPGRLAFDHHLLLGDALERVREALETSTVAARLCGPEFSIERLRTVYEAVWGVSLDPERFAAEATAIPGFLVATDGQTDPDDPSTRLYSAGPVGVLHPPLRRPGAGELSR